MAKAEMKNTCTGCGQSFGSKQELQDHERECQAVRTTQREGQREGQKTRGAGGQMRE